MDATKFGKTVLITGCLFGLSALSFAEGIDDPCAGPTALLNLVDRPTVGDSACVVPFHKVVVEMGYELQRLTPDNGTYQNFPEAEFRFGLPGNNEFVILTPNYIRQSLHSYKGFSATTVAIKHEIGYTQTTVAAVESLVTLPSGSTIYGSNGLGVSLNAILSYNMTPKLNLTFMLSGGSQTTSSFSGGKRFMSINPDLVLTYSLVPKFDIYGELYGQSKVAPSGGAGCNFDGGVVYLLTPKMTVDFEMGQRVAGSLQTLEHYVGTGFALML